MDETGGFGIEMEERSPGAQSRQLSLESQRERQPSLWALRWLLGISSVASRGFVGDAIEEGANAYLTNALIFLRDFNHTSHLPNAHVQEIFDVFIRLRHMGTESEETTLGHDRLELPEASSLYDWLNSLSMRLNEANDASFVLCCMAADTAHPTRSTVRWRRTHIFRGALIFLIASCNWHISRKTIVIFTKAPRAPDFSVDLKLPSTGEIESSDLYEGATEFSLSIKWQYTVAKYRNDLDTYVWKLYSLPPPFWDASLFISRVNTSCVPRALILFSSSRSLHSFRQRYDSISGMFSPIQSPAIGLLRTVYAVYGVALKETNSFLQDISLQVFEITFKARNHPSKQKYQHLLFLNDCCKRTDMDMASNLKVIDSCTEILQRFIPISNDTEEARLLHKIMDELRRDITYIQFTLKAVGGNIEKLQIEVESQNNLQSRNTIVVTILAAIYVPLAFVTSFLGMNVNEGSVKNWLNITSYGNDNSNDLNNSTSSNSSTVTNDTNQDSPTSQLWDLRWFALLSAPLLFGTIILPLITGPIIRYLCQLYVKQQLYRRLGFVLLVTAFLVTGWIPNLSERVYVGNFMSGDFVTFLIAMYQTQQAGYSRQNRRYWFLRTSLIVSWLCAVINNLNWILAVPINIGLAAWVAFIVFQMIFSCLKRAAKNSTASG